MFSDGERTQAFFYPISFAATEGTCGGLEYSSWSLPVFFMLAPVFLSLHRNLQFFVGLFRHIVYGWIVMLLYAQRYFLHNTYCRLHST